MDWTSPSLLRARIERLWDSGELARLVLGSDGRSWPLRIALRAPSAKEMTEGFEAVRHWIASLESAAHWRLEWREISHRIIGRQRLPVAALIDDLDQALAICGRRRDAARLQSLARLIEAESPALLPWLTRRPLQAIEIAEEWPRLLAVVDWMVAHPRPGLFTRQIDVPGVDTKFIENRRGLLAELLDLALPAWAVSWQARGASSFARRYGLLDKPERIRLRLLDPALLSLPGTGGRLLDLSLDAGSFALLDLPVRRVFITENEINFLAFPPQRAGLAIFGAGYGWATLAQARWLQACDIRYWGDIDTHGFAILDQLRAHLPGVRSLLMDRDTLIAHQAQWGEEPAPTRIELARLTNAERALYDDLRFEHLRPKLRLEQERIRWQALEAALQDRQSGSDAPAGSEQRSQ
jgi:hypothetical protein